MLIYLVFVTSPSYFKNKLLILLHQACQLFIDINERLQNPKPKLLNRNVFFRIHFTVNSMGVEKSNAFNFFNAYFSVIHVHSS